MREQEQAMQGVNAAKMLLLTLLFVLVRFLALSPLLLGGWTDRLSVSRQAALGIRMGASLLLFLLLCWPERLFRLHQFKKICGSGEQGFSYGASVMRGLWRLFRVLPALLLFSVTAGTWLYIFFIGNFKSLSILKQVGTLAGGSYDRGAALLFLALMLFALVLALLWHRDRLLDYFPNRAQAKRIKKNNGGALLRLSLTNFCLALPALLAWAAVLGMAAIRDLSFDKGFMSLAMDAMDRLKTLMSNEMAVYLALIFLFLYCPAFIVRKWRTARLCVRLEEKDAA